MADVDGFLINGDTFDPLQENATGDPQATVTTDPLSEPGNATEIFNTTTASGGGGATVVRQNPELTRTTP
jgi:hypothetical protein